MKKKIKNLAIFIFALLLSIALWGAGNVNAEETSPCYCIPPGTSWLLVGDCAECPGACAASFNLGSDNFTQRTCGEADPIAPGAKKCFCQIQITTPPAMPLDECIDGCAGNHYSYIWTPPSSPVEEGDSCATPEDCSGGGTCGENRCFCNSETSRCDFKYENDADCTKDDQCQSGYCKEFYSYTVGSNVKKCTAAGARPPQPSESELFPTYNLNSPIGEVSAPGLIGRIIKSVISIVGALALAMFIYGGFTWLTSGGSSDKIKKGRDILIWATIGLIVIFASYTLVDFLLRAFGL